MCETLSSSQVPEGHAQEYSGGSAGAVSEEETPIWPNFRWLRRSVSPSLGPINRQFTWPIVKVSFKERSLLPLSR